MTDNAIGPGSMLLCVDSGPPKERVWRTGEILTVGAVYEVGDCWLHTISEDPIVSLVGHERKPYDGELYPHLLGSRMGYGLFRFIPAGRRGDFSLLLNIEKTVKEEA